MVGSGSVTRVEIKLGQCQAATLDYNFHIMPMNTQVHPCTDGMHAQNRTELQLALEYWRLTELSRVS